MNGEEVGQVLWGAMKSLKGMCKDGRTEEVEMGAEIWGNTELVSISADIWTMLTADQSFRKRGLIGMGIFYHQWKYFTPRKDAEKSESSGCRPVVY